MWQETNLPHVQHRWTKNGARVTRWHIKNAKSNKIVILIRRSVPGQGFPIVYRRTWELS